MAPACRPRVPSRPSAPSRSPRAAAEGFEAPSRGPTIDAAVARVRTPDCRGRLPIEPAGRRSPSSAGPGVRLTTIDAEFHVRPLVQGPWANPRALEGWNHEATAGHGDRADHRG